MEGFLAAARAVHFASAISLAGVFFFLSFVAGGEASPRLRRQLSLVAWASLATALVSGALWLMLLSAQLSGQSLAAAFRQGAVATVLSRTRFGGIWVARSGLAAIVALLLLLPQGRRGSLWRWTGLVVSAAILASLAWAGHGGATPGRPGSLHLAADLFHLLAAGAWLGSLIPLALSLADIRRDDDLGSGALARRTVARFSLLAAISVTVLFAAGLVNTWFLAGTVPALIGTGYGRLLLAKIGIFVVMVTIAAVNLLRMTPRLPLATGDHPQLFRAALGHLRRNALVEAALGLGVLCIVGVLGILPPGLHTEPGWPLSFRLELGALPGMSKMWLATLAMFGGGFAIVGVAVAAAGRYRAMTTASSGLAICLGLAGILLRPAIEPAYPTSFYAPAEPYAASSITHGARLYAENCALCHGVDGKGDGPAAAALPVRPADLTAAHLFAHKEGDLFWWVSQGESDGVMPGFAAVMRPEDRWDVINFVRARASGKLSQGIGSDLATISTSVFPDFAFEAEGRQQTLDGILQTAPALVMLFGGPPDKPRLAQLAALQKQSAAAGLRILAVGLGSGTAASPETHALPIVAIAPDVAATLALFRTRDEGGETDLMLDRGGNVRARWTTDGAAGLPDAATLVADALRVEKFSARPENHAGHAH